MTSDLSDRVVIPLSKTKIVLLVLGAVGFVLLSVWLWSISDAQSRYSPLLVKGLAIVGAGFFGLSSIYGFVKILDTKPGLILDSSGIIDNTSAVAAGRIPWQEIVGIDVSTVNKQRFLTFKVKNPQKYVERGGILKRTLNAANLKYFGSPIQISSNSLKIKFHDLTDLVIKYYGKNRTDA